MSEFTCAHCRSIIDLDKTKTPTAGTAIFCQACGQVTIYRRKTPNKPLSETVMTYLDYCQETFTSRNASFDAARIQRFETYLAEHNLALDHVQLGDIKKFLDWINATQGNNASKGYESTLMKFFQALIYNGMLDHNPLHKRYVGLRPEPIVTEGLSEEIRAFVEHQEATGLLDNLTFDIRRLHLLEAFLQQRNKNLRMLTEEDVVEFIAEQEKNLTPKQVCGLAMTMLDFYEIMVETGLMAKLPEYPYYFLQYQDIANLILYSEENNQTTDTSIRQLRHAVQSNRDWRVVFLVTTGLLCGFGGLLAYQLLSPNLRQILWVGGLKEKAKAIQEVMQDKQRPNPQVKQPTPPKEPSPPSGSTVKPPVPTSEPPLPKDLPQPSLAQPVMTPEPPLPPKASPAQPDIQPEPPPKTTLPKEISPTTASPVIPQKSLSKELQPVKPVLPVTGSSTQELASPKSPPVKPPLTDCIAGDCQNGVGTFLFPDNSKYIGNWQDGKMHGEGEFFFPSGRGHKGRWHKGRLQVILQ